MRRAVLTAAAFVMLAIATSATGAQTASAASKPHKDKRVCADVTAGTAACHSHVRVLDDGTTPDATQTWSNHGFSPAQLQSGYRAQGATASAVVAVVDAYANPNAYNDLKAYRTNSNWNLGTPVLRQYNQNGTPAAEGKAPAGGRADAGRGS